VIPIFDWSNIQQAADCKAIIYGVELEEGEKLGQK